MVIRLLFTGLVAAAVALPAYALDSRYTDADGDMIADIPADASQQVDPDTLIFAYTPVEDPSVYARVWDGFLKHMEEVTGKKVQFFPVQSNAAQLEAMRAGRLHVAGFNTGSNPLAVNCAGFRPFAMMAASDGSYGYRMAFITHVDSDIQKIEDIRGKTLAFTSETSNSGFKAPSVLLANDFGMEPDRDYTPAFSGKHDNSVLGVYNRDYDAAAIADEIMVRMAARGVIDIEKIRTIYESDPFPTTGYGVVYNLKPELQEKIREAFFSFDWEGSDLQAEFSPFQQEKFIEITYKDHWAPVRRIDELSGVQYTCN